MIDGLAKSCVLIRFKISIGYQTNRPEKPICGGFAGAYSRPCQWLKLEAKFSDDAMGLIILAKLTVVL